MSRKARHTGVVVLVAVLMSLVGCGGGSRITTTSAEAAFRRGAEHFERGRYDRAVEQLQAVFDFGRAHEYAADAQLMLADAYFNDRQYLLASNEYDRFVQLYRGDPRVEQAEFKRAMSFYELSPTFELDQKDTEQAITYLRLYISRYPGGEHAEEAGRLIVELQQKLARKHFVAAELYERQRQYEAAALTYRRVLDEYPNTSLAPEAMLGAIRSYVLFAENSIVGRQAERLDQAIELYERLIQIFPNHPVIEPAEALYRQAVERKQALEGSPVAADGQGQMLN